MLWIDKHQPKDLKQLSYNDDLSNLLTNLALNKDVPHMIFYGASGAGKKTRIMAFLHAVFGDKIFRMKAESIRPEGTTNDFVCCSSMYHNQISAYELGGKDRICIQYLIKQLAAQAPATCFTAKNSDIPRYRVFVIQEAEFLSQEAQAGLRRTLEKYSKNARIILHCQQLSSIMAPLRSRCLCVRVPVPKNHEILNVLEKICKEELIQPSKNYLEEIVTYSDSNLRRAILMLETAAMTEYPSANELKLPWQKICKEIALKIQQHHNVRNLIESRELLYEMLTALIPGSLILETILKCLKEITENQILLHDFIRAASHYAYTLQLGSKEIWHLEAFIAQCMNFSKQHSLPGVA